MPSLSQYQGVLLGTALGDALGLPYEGLSPARAGRLLPPPLRPRFVGRRVMVSDDTEHTIMTAQSLLACPDDADAFARDLGWRLRGWLLGGPAGVGYATLRACLKLWVGIPPSRSGVWSAGNGPAMRATVLGLCLGRDLDRLRAYVRNSTRLTHTDPRAERGALAVALLAAGYTPSSLPELMDMDDELMALLHDWTPRASGVKGYVYDTLGAVITVGEKCGTDFSMVISEAISLGGDADTVAAIVGGVTGARLGREALPAAWLEALWEWPRSVLWMDRLGARLEATFERGERPGPQPVNWSLIPIRNTVFLVAVLAHGFRRLGPPY